MKKTLLIISKIFLANFSSTAHPLPLKGKSFHTKALAVLPLGSQRVTKAEKIFLRRTLLITLALVASFTLGFAFNNFIVQKPSDTKKRVTSIGGIFFKCKDPKTLREWYKTHLGLEVNQYGSVFEWKHAEDSTKKGFTQWSPFKETTNYFAKDWMVNYRVADLVWLVAELKKEGVTIADTIQTYDYGKFVHILDIEGNKVELWEPNDIEYEKMGIQMGSKTTK